MIESLCGEVETADIKSESDNVHFEHPHPHAVPPRPSPLQPLPFLRQHIVVAKKGPCSHVTVRAVRKGLAAARCGGAAPVRLCCGSHAPISPAAASLRQRSAPPVASPPVSALWAAYVLQPPSPTSQRPVLTDLSLRAGGSVSSGGGVAASQIRPGEQCTGRLEPWCVAPSGRLRFPCARVSVSLRPLPRPLPPTAHRCPARLTAGDDLCLYI